MPTTAAADLSLDLLARIRKLEAPDSLLDLLATLRQAEAQLIEMISTAMDLLHIDEEEVIKLIAGELDDLIRWDRLAGTGKVGARIAAIAEQQDGILLERWLTRCWDRAKANR
jgi:hypothetical protein